MRLTIEEVPKNVTATGEAAPSPEKETAWFIAKFPEALRIRFINHCRTRKETAAEGLEPLVKAYCDCLDGIETEEQA